MTDQPGPRYARFASYNMLTMFDSDSAAEQERYGRVIEVIRDLDADVIAVQELSAAPTTAWARLAELAEAVSMRCSIGSSGPKGSPSTYTVAVGAHGLHLGLMWRDGIEPLPHTWRTYGGTDFWHGLAKLTLDIGGYQMTHACYHATPFGRHRRSDEAELVVSLLTGPADSPPVLVGADWNAVGADRVFDQQTGYWAFYDPDPYVGSPWTPDMIYQCEWATDEHGARNHRADRLPGEILSSGGLHDAAAALRAPWQPTLGHWPDDGFSRQGVTARFDAVRVSTAAVPTLRGHRVVRTDMSLTASDHLPVVVEYDPATLASDEDVLT